MKVIWIVVALATLAPSGSLIGLAVSLTLGSLRAESPCLIGTALYGAVRRVVWDPGANHSRGPGLRLSLKPIFGVRFDVFRMMGAAAGA